MLTNNLQLKQLVTRTFFNMLVKAQHFLQQLVHSFQFQTLLSDQVTSIAVALTALFQGYQDVLRNLKLYQIQFLLTWIMTWIKQIFMMFFCQRLVIISIFVSFLQFLMFESHAIKELMQLVGFVAQILPFQLSYAFSATTLSNCQNAFFQNSMRFQEVTF